MSLRLFHGGVPGFRSGDLIKPRRGRSRVFVTPNRLYAKRYAAIHRGDLYEVVPAGEMQMSMTDSIASFHAPAVRVAEVLDQAVLLSDSERQRLDWEWTAADLLHARYGGAELIGGAA